MKNRDLIYRHLLGSLSSEEANTVEELLNTDASFLKEFQEYKDLFEASASIDFKDDSQFDTNAAWSKFETTISEEASPKSLPRKLWTSLYRVAAVVLLVLSFYFFVNKWNTNSFTPGLVYESKKKQSVQGLVDGSQIYLDTSTDLVLDQAFNQEDRKMQLNGKAFFVVKPDKDRVFEVVTNHLTATVKGTTFLIRTDDHSASVGVNTGIVEVHVGNQTVTLIAGEQLDFTTENGGMVSRSMFNEKELKEFQSRSMDFHDTPLRVILNQLKENKGIDIVSPPEWSEERYTMELSDASLDQIIQTIELTTGHKVVENGDSYSLI